MQKITAILIGAGSRGKRYTDIMKEMPDKFEVVAVAEPVESRRNDIKNIHNLPEERCFSDWKELLELGKIADIAIIATMDRDHFAPSMKAIELKYDILLEKPIAPTEEECSQIVAAAKENDVKVLICTVLRYTPLFQCLKKQIDDDVIGKVMSINHEECVGNVHQSHSFVRGNWGNSERSSGMLLQKSCHDMDLLQWLIGKKCKKIQSFGTISYFTKENAPEGAPEYCIDGCPEAERCPYNAVKLYLENEDPDQREWFTTAATKRVNPTRAEIEKVLRETQYGKCVFKCDNDVVDHQVVSLLFEDDVMATFTMNAFNKGGRFIHIMGTKGEMHAVLEDKSPIRIYRFEENATTEIPMEDLDGILGDHSGGSEGIICALYEYLNGTYEGNAIPEIEESFLSHQMVFAAEKSRKENVVVSLDL